MPQDDDTFTSLIKWWRWAREHPRTVVLAGLLLAALVLPSGTRQTGPSVDVEVDEPPLFV